MSTEQMWQTSFTGLETTLAFAEAMGRRLRGGEVIELMSDLGGGKTTFVRGLAAGVGSADKVSSPSFTLRNEYRAGDLMLYHFDFYRLHEPGILRDELAELLHDPQAVLTIEWSDIVQDVLPANRLTVTLAPDAASEATRHATFRYPPKLQYLFEDKGA